MNNLNVSKEIDLLKQTNPVVATAFEKIIKSFTDCISNIESDYGSRLTLIHSQAEKAIDKVNALDKQFSKIKDFSDKTKELEKLQKYLQGKTNEFKVIDNKTHQAEQKLIAFEMTLVELTKRFKEMEESVRGLAYLADSNTQILSQAAISSLAQYPDDFFEILITKTKAKRSQIKQKRKQEYFEFQSKIRKHLVDRGIPVD